MFEVEKIEFNKWLEKYQNSSLGKEEITLINLILSNFDEIAKRGTAAGARAKFIVSKWNELKYKYADELIGEPLLGNKSEKEIKSLFSMEVESFRGFSGNTRFSFAKPYVLFYGTNGSGKSSLCQALEYSLLGTVQEAGIRRIELHKFITNNVTGTAKSPVLQCYYTDDDKKINTAIKDYNKYRFSFIEKNRIDSFSHIHATTTKERNERLSALFGLSGFSAFINEFTDNIDKYVDTSTPIHIEYMRKKESIDKKREELNEKVKSLDFLKSNISTQLKTIKEKNIVSLEDAIVYLQGEKNNGYLSELQKAYEASKQEVYQDGWITELIDAQNNLSKEIDDFKTNQSEIMKLTVDSDFHELYTVINNLSIRHLDYCPACKTPLDKVTVNPFSSALEELNKLQQYDDLKKKIAINITQLKKGIKNFNDIILNNEKCIKLLNIDVKKYKDLYELTSTKIIDAIAEIDDVKKTNELLLNDEETIKTKLNTLNAKAIITNEDNEYRKKYDEYSKLLSQLLQKKGGVESYEKIIADETKAIADFDSEKEEYEIGIKDEDMKVKFNSSFIDAYNKIHASLENYLKSLPISMSKNLSQKVTEYYNIMNSDDAEFEKILKFSLPVSEDDKIILKTKDNIEDDALQILSEGHVKLLGLAILLAKANSTGRNFLIFDDIVNAIDDEHRDGVAELLLKNPDFIDKQIIITCHSEQFIRKLESKIDISLRNNKIIRYHFIDAYTQQERGITFDYSNPKEPLELAELRLKDGDFKDAAAKCRQATESIINQFWKKLNANYGIALEVQLRKPGDIPELASVTNSLIKKLGKMTLSPADSLLIHLKELKDDYNWFLQNKGTHFEDTQFQFEASDVKKLIELLKTLYKEISSLVYTQTITVKEGE